MMSIHGTPKEAPEIIVAGHICLDIIPNLRSGEFGFHPGALREIGEAAISTGGCVGNTGVGLSRLGVGVELVSRIGDDLLGDLLQECLRKQGIRAGAMSRIAGEHTSYSVILSPESEDRMVLHFPGANDSFMASDLTLAFAHPATLFHFGYPPLMRQIYSNGGVELEAVLRHAKSFGMVTSLDMAYPDPLTAAGKVNWCDILRRVLPHVDLFMPSYEEITRMMDPANETFPPIDSPNAALLAPLQRLTSSLLRMGAPVVAIKLGDKGLYLRTAARQTVARLSHVLDAQEWSDRELWTTVFDANVVGTNGAGDATIAGFLLGVLRHFSPQRVCSAACAVGACSVEAADATSGIPHWETVAARAAAGWSTRSAPFLDRMPEIAPGVFCGPLDRHVERRTTETISSQS